MYVCATLFLLLFVGGNISPLDDTRYILHASLLSLSVSVPVKGRIDLNEIFQMVGCFFVFFFHLIPNQFVNLFFTTAPKCVVCVGDDDDADEQSKPANWVWVCFV